MEKKKYSFTLALDFTPCSAGLSVSKYIRSEIIFLNFGFFSPLFGKERREGRKVLKGGGQKGRQEGMRGEE